MHKQIRKNVDTRALYKNSHTAIPILSISHLTPISNNAEKQACILHKNNTENIKLLPSVASQYGLLEQMSKNVIFNLQS
jgi:hypothetical protein